MQVCTNGYPHLIDTKSVLAVDVIDVTMRITQKPRFLILAENVVGLSQQSQAKNMPF